MTHDGYTWLLMMKKIDWLVGLGVLARPGTPRDLKSHLFVTNRVANRPFCMILRPAGAEFRSGARQIGPTPSISTLFRPFLDPKMPKMPKSGHVFERIASSPGGLGNSSPYGAQGAHVGPWGAKSAPYGALGAPWGPIYPPILMMMMKFSLGLPMCHL